MSPLLDASSAPENGMDVTERDEPAVESGSGIVETWISLQFTWSGRSFSLDIADTDTVYDLKGYLHSQTLVPPERQKILGLVKGKLPPDQVRITDLKLASGKKFSLVGTPEGGEIKDPSALEALPDIVNDFDLDMLFMDFTARNRYLTDPRNVRKVKEYTSKTRINIIHPVRPGKKLLVLDIDYTILDTKPLLSGSLPPAECARPGLHEFLEAIYPFYDICIWSQTSWIWLETKMVELGMVGGNRNYQISFVLDKTSMFTVFSQRDNKPWRHSVKPLQIIWNLIPQFGPRNTIHIDDLSRNFALNPGQGLKIQAFKNAHTQEAVMDRELEKLGRYMLSIANVEDFRTLEHNYWKDVVKKLPRS
ncbi:HAD subfamily IIID h [Guyanagaster necrorhizus]|uniref:protein-serine/threonine phosphatase n=1 Tax=Guyanagaster necrorhizus TaxID=856835 RepID=A0A9P7VX68_9AGAR|nr:HAD subfamily IIID h [Guyanagaster necrorhizus MCA 3950]KAG7448212.1 HAD subfamily IIID h [Guyanagaster necrorhizus MCA 3950]